MLTVMNIQSNYFKYMSFRFNYSALYTVITLISRENISMPEQLQRKGVLPQFYYIYRDIDYAIKNK